MAIRNGHGAGRGRPHVEVLPPDELPPATPAIAVRSDRTGDGRFAPGNEAARAQKTRPGPLGSLGYEKTDPAYSSFLRWGRRYASHRREELARAHGGEISAGVGAMVESAGLALAASRFLHAKGSETCDPELLKRASALANDARQHELAAWELAARECAARPKTAVDPLAKWMVPAAEEKPK